MLEFDQHIDVALRPEIIAQDRAEESQLADVILAAELRQFLTGDVDLDLIHEGNYSKVQSPSMS